MRVRFLEITTSAPAAGDGALTPGSRSAWPGRAGARPGDLLVVRASGSGQPTGHLCLVLDVVPPSSRLLLHTLRQPAAAIGHLEAIRGAVREGESVTVPVRDLREAFARLGLDPEDAEAVRARSAARALAHGVPLTAVDSLLEIGESLPAPWPSVGSRAGLALLTSIRSSADPRRAATRRAVTSPPVGDAPDRLGDRLLSEVNALAPEGFAPGELITSALVLPAGGDGRSQSGDWDYCSTAVDTLLVSGSGSGPARLDGQTEYGPGDRNRAVQTLLSRLQPAEPLGGALTSRFAMPLDVGGTRQCPAWQLAIYLEPPAVAGWRMNSLPPLTWIVALIECDEDAVLLEHVLDTHHRGRARVFREEYLDHVPAGARDGRPRPWVDDDLRRAVELVREPGPALGIEDQGSLRSETVATLFRAAVSAKAALVRQELAIDQRRAGALWKAEIQSKDLRILCQPSREEDRSALESARWVLLSPTQHYLSQLSEVHGHLAELNARAAELFGVVSAMSERALLARTDAARRAGIVAGFVTAILAVIAVFAALAAIPVTPSRAINPILRNVSLAGLLVVGALMVGLVASHLAARVPGTRASTAPAQVPLTPRDRRSRLLTGLELASATLSVGAFAWGVVAPSIPVVVAAWVLIAAPLLLHLLRQEF